MDDKTIKIVPNERYEEVDRKYIERARWCPCGAPLSGYNKKEECFVCRERKQRKHEEWYEGKDRTNK